MKAALHGVAAAVAAALLMGCEPRKADPRYTVTADTVVDSATGLTWQRRPSEQNMPLDTAQAHCAALNVEGSGWRVPLKSELMTLAHRAGAFEMLRNKAAIDRVAFPGTRTANYWAEREPTDGKMVRGWVVDFATGGHNNLVQPGEGYYVRCVR